MSDPTEPTPGRRPASSGKRGRPPDLKAFLTGASKPEDALSYHELQGFLFAIVSAPDMVPPSEWVPMVLGEREPAFQDGAEAQRLLGELMQLYNDLNTQVLANAVALPSDCRFRSDLLSNFTEDAPVSQWSRGFVRGHTWLKESWKPLPDSLEDELGALLVTLSIFSSQRLAAKFVAEGAKPGKRLGSAMRNLAIGIKPMEEALAEHKRLENTPEERERQRKEAEWRASSEVRGAMSQIQERQWEGWLDGKIPALDGLTPREAVRRPEGREMVEALLLQFERDRPPGQGDYDFNRLRRKLGLAAR